MRTSTQQGVQPMQSVSGPSTAGRLIRGEIGPAQAGEAVGKVAPGSKAVATPAQLSLGAYRQSAGDSDGRAGGLYDEAGSCCQLANLPAIERLLACNPGLCSALSTIEWDEHGRISKGTLLLILRALGDVKAPTEAAGTAAAVAAPPAAAAATFRSSSQQLVTAAGTGLVSLSNSSSSNTSRPALDAAVAAALVGAATSAAEPGSRGSAQGTAPAFSSAGSSLRSSLRPTLSIDISSLRVFDSSSSSSSDEEDGDGDGDGDGVAGGSVQDSTPAAAPANAAASSVGAAVGTAGHANNSGTVHQKKKHCSTPGVALHGPMSILSGGGRDSSTDDASRAAGQPASEQEASDEEEKESHERQQQQEEEAWHSHTAQAAAWRYEQSSGVHFAASHLPPGSSYRPPAKTGSCPSTAHPSSGCHTRASRQPNTEPAGHACQHGQSSKQGWGHKLSKRPPTPGVALGQPISIFSGSGASMEAGLVSAAVAADGGSSASYGTYSGSEDIDGQHAGDGCYGCASLQQRGKANLQDSRDAAAGGGARMHTQQHKQQHKQQQHTQKHTQHHTQQHTQQQQQQQQQQQLHQQVSHRPATPGVGLGKPVSCFSGSGASIFAAEDATGEPYPDREHDNKKQPEAHLVHFAGHPASAGSSSSSSHNSVKVGDTKRSMQAGTAKHAAPAHPRWQVLEADPEQQQHLVQFADASGSDGDGAHGPACTKGQQQHIGHEPRHQCNLQDNQHHLAQGSTRRPPTLGISLGKPVSIVSGSTSDSTGDGSGADHSGQATAAAAAAAATVHQESGQRCVEHRHHNVSARAPTPGVSLGRQHSFFSNNGYDSGDATNDSKQDGLARAGEEDRTDSCSRRSTAGRSSSGGSRQRDHAARRVSWGERPVVGDGTVPAGAAGGASVHWRHTGSGGGCGDVRNSHLLPSASNDDPMSQPSPQHQQQQSEQCIKQNPAANLLQHQPMQQQGPLPRCPEELQQQQEEQQQRASSRVAGAPAAQAAGSRSAMLARLNPDLATEVQHHHSGRPPTPGASLGKYSMFAVDTDDTADEPGMTAGAHGHGAPYGQAGGEVAGCATSARPEVQEVSQGQQQLAGEDSAAPGHDQPRAARSSASALISHSPALAAELQQQWRQDKLAQRPPTPEAGLAAKQQHSTSIFAEDTAASSASSTTPSPSADHARRVLVAAFADAAASAPAAGNAGRKKLLLLKTPGLTAEVAEQLRDGHSQRPPTPAAANIASVFSERQAGQHSPPQKQQHEEQEKGKHQGGRGRASLLPTPPIAAAAASRPSAPSSAASAVVLHNPDLALDRQQQWELKLTKRPPTPAAGAVLGRAPNMFADDDGDGEEGSEQQKEGAGQGSRAGSRNSSCGSRGMFAAVTAPDGAGMRGNSSCMVQPAAAYVAMEAASGRDRSPDQARPSPPASSCGARSSTSSSGAGVSPVLQAAAEQVRGADTSGSCQAGRRRSGSSNNSSASSSPGSSPLRCVTTAADAAAEAAMADASASGSPLRHSTSACDPDPARLSPLRNTSSTSSNATGRSSQGGSAMGDCACLPAGQGLPASAGTETAAAAAAVSTGVAVASAGINCLRSSHGPSRLQRSASPADRDPSRSSPLSRQGW